MRYNNWDDITTLMQRFKPNTIVILSVEDVILAPTDQILQSRHRPVMRNLSGRLENLYPEHIASEVLSLQIKERHIALVDPKIRDIISNLKNKGVKVIAISNGWTGHYGVIPSLENLQVNTLEELGVDLSWSFADSVPIILEDYKTADPERFPSFRRGVLFTCHMAKGEVLQALFARLNWQPEEIFFVDSLTKHIDSAMSYCQRYNIAFTGVLYEAAYNQSNPELNRDRAELQFDILGRQRRWINDNEADEILRLKKVE